MAAIEDIALVYFEDVAGGRLSDSAEPGSPAELYSAYLEDLNVTSGQTSSEVTVVDGDVVIDTKYVDGSTDSVTFSEIEVSPGGVRNFAVNGNLISDRIAVSSQPVSSNGIEVLRVISYISASGHHFVAATITNTNDTEFDAGGPPSFVDSNGRQVESDSFLETYSVRPGATAVVAFSFPGGDTPTGTVYIDGSTNDFATDVPLVIEVSQQSE